METRIWVKLLYKFRMAAISNDQLNQFDFQPTNSRLSSSLGL